MALRHKCSKIFLTLLIILLIHLSSGSAIQKKASNPEHNDEHDMRVDRPRRDITDPGFFFRLFRPPHAMFKHIFSFGPWSPFYSKSLPWATLMKQHRAQAWAAAAERREATAVLPGERIQAVLTRGQTGSDRGDTLTVVYVQHHRRLSGTTETTRFAMFGDAVDAAIRGQKLRVIESAAPVSARGPSLVIKVFTDGSRPPPTLRHCLDALARQVPDFLPEVAYDYKFGKKDYQTQPKPDALNMRSNDRGYQNHIISKSLKAQDANNVHEFKNGIVRETNFNEVAKFKAGKTDDKNFVEVAKQSRPTENMLFEGTKGFNDESFDKSAETKFENFHKNAINKQLITKKAVTKESKTTAFPENEKYNIGVEKEIEKRNEEHVSNQQKDMIDKMAKEDGGESIDSKNKVTEPEISTVVQPKLEIKLEPGLRDANFEKDVTTTNSINKNDNNNNNNKNNSNVSVNKSKIEISQQEQKQEGVKEETEAKESMPGETKETDHMKTKKKSLKRRSLLSVTKDVHPEKEVQDRAKDKDKAEEKEDKDEHKDHDEPEVDIHAIVLVEKKTTKQEDDEKSDDPQKSKDKDPGYKTPKDAGNKADKKKSGHHQKHHHNTHKVTHVHAVVFLTVFLVALLAVVGLVVHGSRAEAKRAPSRTQLVTPANTQPPSYF